MHAFHTLDLELNRDMKVEKTCWDEAYLDRLRAAAAAAKNVRSRWCSPTSTWMGSTMALMV